MEGGGAASTDLDAEAAVAEDARADGAEALDDAEEGAAVLDDQVGRQEGRRPVQPWRGGWGGEGGLGGGDRGTGRRESLDKSAGSTPRNNTGG